MKSAKASHAAVRKILIVLALIAVPVILFLAGLGVFGSDLSPKPLLILIAAAAVSAVPIIAFIRVFRFIVLSMRLKAKILSECAETAAAGGLHSSASCHADADWAETELMQQQMNDNVMRMHQQAHETAMRMHEDAMQMHWQAVDLFRQMDYNPPMGF